MADPRRVPCRKCGEPIIFVMSLKGRAIPCNPVLEIHPLKPGVVVVTEDGRVMRGTKFAGDAEVRGYTSHFSTCEYADSFRKPVERSQR